MLFVVFGRYVTGSVIAALVWWRQGAPPFTAAMARAHAVLGGLIALTAALFFFAIHTLPLAEAITLSFTAPLMVPPLAHFVLGERMRGSVFVAGLIGFIGVVVTVHGAPSFSGARLPALAAILGASLTYALSAIAMRARAAADGSTRLTLSGAVIPMVLLSPFAFGQVLPRPVDWTWFVAAGFSAMSEFSSWRGRTPSSRFRFSLSSNSPRYPGRHCSAGSSSVKTCARRLGWAL